MANILKTSFLSSQGDKTATLNAVKSQNIRMSEKEVLAIEGDVKIPFYAFEVEVKDTQTSIYKALYTQVKAVVGELSKEQRKETILIIGTSIIDWNIADAIESKELPYSSKKLSIDTYAKELSREFGFNGFTLTINTACTSSANALLETNNLLNAGIYKYGVVLGCEIFSHLMSSGFNAMQLLSQTSIKPFCETRDGMILGEGVVAFLLGNDNSPWHIKGAFSNCNGVNITAVSPEGDEFSEVMQRALNAADIRSCDITALKAHATATLSNDLSEQNAIKRVFGDDVKCSALKPYIGHTVGACGLLEMALFMECIDDGFIPRTIKGEDIVCENGLFMMNYFGFGGNNTSIIIEKEKS
ncbi:3-oxoacyl-ACP synthase [Sulfurimonas sp. SAG-AH-194-C21]|nr:beta-ketoacyl synthase N-terminal-like domain-containing protein [Sulfurimonas sp. SAG-AH-194-C21]MDF1883124.1 3-oxoacyl-ACP synthase [Sulfurimonas sp. SAG-AH-194-C21]